MWHSIPKRIPLLPQISQSSSVRALQSVRSFFASSEKAIHFHGSFAHHLLLTVFKMKSTVKTSDQHYKLMLKQIAPPLTVGRHKGQAGRIGIFGGSLEYTGAPYFAAISSLRVGADLAHVFCTKEAAPVIKSYSPELIVHPLLDATTTAKSTAIELIEPWLHRLHTIVIGPGLGRESATLAVIEQVVAVCNRLCKPLIIDADGLFLVGGKPTILKDYSAPVVLTPNSAEFQRLVGNSGGTTRRQQATERLLNLTPNLTLVVKGAQDEILNADCTVIVDEEGSGRRCGGQGDLLAGALATFLAWMVDGRHPITSAAVVAGYAACTLTRRCNQRAFAKHGRSMLVSDMIQEVHAVFESSFEVE